jgi:hypothetical protein
VGQIITAHLVKLDFPYYNVLILPLAYGVFDSLGPFLQQHAGFGWPSALGDGGYQVAYMFMMLGTAIGVYGSFVVSTALLIVPESSSLLSTRTFHEQSFSTIANVSSRSMSLLQSVTTLTSIA